MSTKKIYECGTLRYTAGGLIITTALIMVGFFGMQFAALAVNKIIPLHLKGLDSNDTLIAFIMTTISSILNMTVCPAVSFKSDRYRRKKGLFGRFGRRIVYIIGTLPMFAGTLILFGFADKIGEGLSKILGSWGGYSPVSLTIATIAVIMLCYQFFYMFVASVIYYIYNDVIPQQFLTKVVGLVQVTTTAASAIFNFFLFKYSQTHYTEIMVGIGILYIVSVGLMCLFVKEPDYPPLTAEEERQSRGGTGILTFLRESFVHPFYWYAFLLVSFFSVSTSIGTYMTFFYMDMGLSLEKIGNLDGTIGIASMVLSMCIATVGALLIDRWHPMRVHFYARIGCVLIPLVMFKWLFFTSSPERFFLIFLIFEILVLAPNSIASMSSLPTYMRVFPKSRFGQFCSAQALIRSLAVMGFTLVMGACIDFGRKLLGNGDFIYRYLAVWRCFWGLLGAVCIVLMYREWKKLGGDKNYRAPAPWQPDKFEAMENAPVIGPVPKLVRLGLLAWDAIVALYVIGVIALAGYYRELGFFLLWCGPCAVIMLLLWLRIRFGISKRAEQGDVPHHGALFLLGLQQFLLWGGAIFQFCLTRDEGGAFAARLYFGEMLIGLVALLLLGVCAWVEKSPSDRISN